MLLLAYGTNLWGYTTSETEILHNGVLYQPLPMQRGNYKNNGDVAKSSLTVQLPQDIPIGELFRIQPPSGVVSVTLFGYHDGDTEFKVFWKGRVVNAEWQQPWVIFTCENVFSSLQRVGLRRKYSTQCPLVLYSTGVGQCNVNKATYKQTMAVNALSGITVTCNAAIGRANNYYAGGYAEWLNPSTGATERRMIRSSNGTTGALTLAAIPVGLTAGMNIDTYPGCDHMLGTCNTKFANSLNFGGTPFIPLKNPFKSMLF